jgi:ubiquinone/menaquinone biosynthesis C-methylase UbiE
VKAYYDARAPEYDDWYRGVGRLDTQQRPGWDEELHELEAVLRALGRARTLDVACGTAFLSRNLAGPLTLLDQSPRMLEIASARLPDAVVAQADALEGLPFPEQRYFRAPELLDELGGGDVLLDGRWFLAVRSP